MFGRAIKHKRYRGSRSFISVQVDFLMEFDGELDEVRGPVDLVFVEVGVIAGRVLQFVVGHRPTVHGPAAAVVEG